MQIKTTMRYNPTITRMAIITKKRENGKNVDNRAPFYTVSGNVNWFNKYGKQYGDTLKN